MALLDDNEIEKRLETMDRWRREGRTIVKDFELGDFAGSVEFVNALAVPAEEMGHHPDLVISWDRVTVSLSTHSQGGVTEADLRLAAAIDSLVQRS